MPVLFKTPPERVHRDTLTAAHAKFTFCKRHVDMEILQKGRKAGYPERRFNERVIAKWIRKLLSELQKFEKSAEFVTAIRSQTNKTATARSMYSRVITNISVSAKITLPLISKQTRESNGSTAPHGRKSIHGLRRSPPQPLSSNVIQLRFIYSSLTPAPSKTLVAWGLGP